MIENTDIARCVLAETVGNLEFSDLQALRDISAHMLSQARRQLIIFSHDLDARVFDQPLFLEGARHLALRSRHARIEVLLQNNARIVKEGHRLVELARRLSSTIEVRKPHPDHLQLPENFMLVDNSGFVYRKLASRYQGVASFHDPLENRRLRECFREMWESSEPDPEMRRLYI